MHTRRPRIEGLPTREPFFLAQNSDYANVKLLDHPSSTALDVSIATVRQVEDTHVIVRKGLSIRRRRTRQPLRILSLD